MVINNKPRTSCRQKRCTSSDSSDTNFIVEFDFHSFLFPSGKNLINMSLQSLYRPEVCEVDWQAGQELPKREEKSEN